MQNTSKKSLDTDYAARIIAITIIFYLTVFLSGKYGLNTSLLVVNIISLVVTPVIWKYDNILRLDVKWKYIGYYLVLLILAQLVFPTGISTIGNILYRQGFREEVIYRFFMIGIFLKYGYSKEGQDQKKFLVALLHSNFLFMLGHSYGVLGLFYIFGVGLVFSYIYLIGGLPSSILAHTIHNLYRAEEQTLVILLLLVPLAVHLPIVKDFRIRVENFFNRNGAI